MSRKTLVCLVGTWSLCLVFLVSGCALDSRGEETVPQVEAADVVIGVSPFLPEATAAAVRNSIFRIILEKVPSGSRVTIFDAYHLKRITDFRIPSRRAFDLLKIRSKYLGRNLLDIQSFGDASTTSGSGNGELTWRIRVPQFLDFIASSRLEKQPPATVVLLGGALYLDERDGRFSMENGRFPTDDHLCVKRKESVFGVADRSGQLKGARVHYSYLGEPWISDLHEAPVRRFWSLFIEQQGGELVTFAGDLPTVVDRMAQPDAHSPQRYELRCPPQSKLEMAAVKRPEEAGEGWLVDTQLPFAVAPPSRTRGPLKIGIRWSCLGCDLDLYSRPAAEAAELFYGNPRTEEGVYFKDYLTSPTPVNGYEWVEYLEPVDLTEVEAAVNFYGGQSAGGVSGEVRVQVGESTYRGEFEIKASEGNRSAEGDDRADSAYWTVLDLGALVGLGKDRRQAGQAVRSKMERTLETPVAAQDEPPAAVQGAELQASRSAAPARGVRILSPKDGSTIRAHGGASGPVEHPVDGDVYGFDQAEIRKFRLTVEVLILTDRWYPQGIASVRDDGTWRLPTAWFGGSQHTVRAVLKDHNDNEIHSHEVNVTVVH